MVTHISHPIAQVAITALRDKSSGVLNFRANMKRLAQFVATEATKNLATTSVPVETPLAWTSGVKLSKPVVLMPILRAGLGMVEALLELVPEASVGHVGLCRNEHTFEPETYYFKAPNLAEVTVLILDPMLATGNSAIDAINKIKDAGAKDITMLSIIASTDGLQRVQKAHPDVHIIVGTVDPALNAHAYIVPGLGDAGDRYFGTTQ